MKTLEHSLATAQYKLGLVTNLPKHTGGRMQIPVRALLVEDDPDIITLLQTALEPTFECIIARNGLEALQIALEGEPDLIISDIMMPVVDGHEMIRRLRKYPELNEIPVIFLSALGSQDNIKKGYSLGAALYLTKPIDPSRFKRNVEMFVSDHSIAAKPKRDTAREVIQKFLIKKSLTPKPEDGVASGGAARVRPTTLPPRAAVSPRPHETQSRPRPAAPQAHDTQSRPRPGAAAPHETQSRPKPAPEHRNAPTESAPHVEPSAPRVPRVSSGQAKVSMPKPKPITETHEAPPPAPEEARVRLLIVEEDMQLSKVLLEGLMREFEVIPASDGIEAIERAARYQPDIFVVDSKISKINGYQLVMMLRKNAMFNNSPIIFASDKDNDRDRQYVEKLGVQCFLTKPYDAAQLKAVIAKCINEPFFEMKRNRIGYRDALLELSASEGFGSIAGEAMRVANILKAESMPATHKQREQRDSWMT